MFSSLSSDLRFAFRTMARRPLFFLILISILGIGLGANAAMFSVIDSVLLEPLPYPDSDRLAWVWGRTPEGSNNTISAEDYVDLQEARSFAALAAYGFFPEEYVTGGGAEPEILVGAIASWNLFRALGVEPRLGRAFVIDDASETSGDPVILSHGLWQRRFGGDPSVLNRTLVLDGRPYEIVGVMPPGMGFPTWAELWRPMRMTEGITRGRGNRNFLVFGRLNPGVTPEQAEAELVTIAAGLAETYPEANEGWSMALIPLQELFVGGVRTVLWLLLGAVGLVLLIACGNVAALLLARASGRENELAVRVALGASRGRLVRHVMTESVVTALVGGLLGIGVAYGALWALRVFGGGTLPSVAVLELDGSALLFTLVLSMATGLLFGAAPALRSPQRNLVESLKEGHRGQRRAGGLRLQNALVVGQVALSLVLLVGSGLLIRSFLKVQQVQMGFEPAGVIAAEIHLPRASYGAERPPQLFYDEVLDRVRALPGVEAAGVVTSLPVVGGFGPWNYVHADGQPPATPADRRGATRRFVSPGYFVAMGIPISRGRDFQRSDGQDAPNVAIISQRFADDFFPGLDPIGRTIVLPWDPPLYFQVIGVAGDVKLGPLESDTWATMYWSLAQAPVWGTNLVVRTSGEAATLAPALRSAIRDIDPTVPISDLRTMNAVVSSSLAQNRFRTVLLGSFAGVALLLAALGLYGVLAQLVSRRTHELGVRMALGADGQRLMGWVLRHGLLLAGLGILLGLVGAIAGTRLVRSVLYEVEPLDVFTFGVTAVSLAAVALAAAAIPAWRASRVDPVECLRSE